MRNRRVERAEDRAYRIADNKLGELADWDESRLAEELRELEALSMDLNLLGFTQDELDQLFGEKTQDAVRTGRRWWQEALVN